jgi:hypothetical protein
MGGLKTFILGVYAVSVIAGLELYALSLGHDGVVLAASIASITGIVAGICGFNLGKVTVEK